MTRTVVGINRMQEEALLSTGEIVPVVAWFDLDGDLCDQEAAVTCAAGADGIGWWAIDLSDYAPVTIH
jgi:hypothetical protein